ncbi:hypothetical protein N657DRAFT_646417 [Parathielavia appendiculata]|uniref:Uncharacterized protein n=1 Tax=Parathielavia appendiculata TaxID=2587402 RepID=A0AAN6TXQ4_9PEZI|nr:hypothetical protein N657DRAFT_646417 [Parathielavia appendiculata]
MAGDSEPSRPRQSSAASGTRSIAIHARQQSKRPVQAQSQHVADPVLHDFLSPSYDAASYLNITLPPLQTSSRVFGSQGSNQGAVPLAELSIQTQALLSQLNAHTTRLTDTLTELTNDILRSGGRLAYEVELLRGETLGLAETLTEGLEDDIAKFVPGGIRDSITEPRGAAADSHAPSFHQRRMSLLAPPATTATTEKNNTPSGAAQTTGPPDEPPYIAQLRTLTLVRSRLESVIKIFGDAMEFVFPPSELSVSSSFLSVSAPDAGGESHSTEEKGRQVLQSLRDEIARLLGNAEDPIKGIEDAARRIEELKELATVWKGTAEEKGRSRFIESLAKMVEDRHRELLRDADQSSRRDNARPQMATSSTGAAGAEVETGQAETKGYGAYGLISQLQKLRSGL